MKNYLLHASIIASFATFVTSCSNDANFDEFTYPKTEVTINLDLPLENQNAHKLLDSATVHVQDQLFAVSSWYGNIAVNGEGRKVNVRNTQSTPFTLSPEWSGYLTKRASAPSIQVYSCLKDHTFNAETEKEWKINTEPTVALLILPNNTDIEINTKLGKAQKSHFFTKDNQKCIYIYCDYELGSDKHAIFKPIDVTITTNGETKTVTCEKGKIYNTINNQVINF